MKMFYVVEENYVKVSDTDSRLVSYDIKEAFNDFLEAAEYVNNIFVNKNRRGSWKACAGGMDGEPVNSIKKTDECSSTRIYVKH